MAITFPLTLPTNRNPVDLVLGQRKVVGVNTAPTTLVPQTYEWPGEMWTLDISFQVMERAVGAPWAATLRSLRGPVGSFLYGDPTGAAPLGTAAGSPVVSSTTAAGSRTLPVSGGTGTLLKGSMISLGSGATRRLYEVQEDVANLASATLSIWPALRGQASSSAPVVLTSTSGLFMLRPGTQIDVAIDRNGHYRIAPVRAIEDLR